MFETGVEPRIYAGSIVLNTFLIMNFAWVHLGRFYLYMFRQFHLFVTDFICCVTRHNLNIQISHTERVGFDKGTAGLNLVAHEGGKDVIGGDDIFDLDSH